MSDSLNVAHIERRPKLQRLVTAREGKHLIQQCLVPPKDGQEHDPSTKFPDPKVRQYNPARRQQRDEERQESTATRRSQAAAAPEPPVPVSSPPLVRVTQADVLPYSMPEAPLSSAAMYAPINSFTYPPYNNAPDYYSPTSIPMPPIPAEPAAAPEATAPRLKKRKTVENMRKAKAEASAKLLNAADQAAQALDTARRVSVRSDRRN